MPAPTDQELLDRLENQKELVIETLSGSILEYVSVDDYYKPINRKKVIMNGEVVLVNDRTEYWAFLGDDVGQAPANDGKKPTGGYIRKVLYDQLNVNTVQIPQNFAGLEAETMPPRLMYQLFRIEEVVENEDYVEVTARHVWYDNLKNFTLWEVPKANKDTDYTAAAICRNIMTNAVSPADSRVASDCTDTIKGSEIDYARKNLVEAFLDAEKGVCARFGLSLIRNNWDFYCLKNVGYDRGFIVEDGKNLLGVERKESIENLATRVAPYGKDKKGNIVWLDYNGKKYIDSQYIVDYSCPHVELYDTGLQIGKSGVTAQNIQEKLLEAGQKRFTDDHVDLPSVEMTIEFVSLGDTEEYRQYRGLDKVYLYDTITIHDKVRGYSYTAQVVGVEHDILTGMLESVTIGKLDNWEGTRKIATWQVPEVSGENIRLLTIQAGSFEEGAIYGEDIAEAVISYAHFASATIDSLTADALEAARAHIHELIAGSITANDIQAGSITTELLAAGLITTEKLAADAVTAGKIAAAAITSDKIAANAVTAGKIAANAVTADTIAAGAISASKIDTSDLNAINATLGTANIADARIAVADINYAHVKDLDAQSAYFGQAIIQEGLANKLYIPRLAANYAQIVNATISDLVIQASDDNYYKLDIDLSGNVTATQISPSAQEIEDGHTTDGRTIYMGTDIVATDLNTQNIYASHALMDEITANIINVDKLFAREATIARINATDLSSNTYIQATIGNWQSGSTITQTLAGLESRVSSLGYGTIYYSTTEPSHSGLVQGDIWVQPLDDHIWEDYTATQWQDILDEGSWGSVLGSYKVYTWTGQVWKVLFDSSVNAEMWTAIEQNSAAIALKANQTAVDLLSGEVSDFSATLEVQAQEISTAVSAVNAKVASYIGWADPSLTHTIVLGDIWIRTHEDFGSWLDTLNSDWQNLVDNYDWGDALGEKSYIWDGTKWIEYNDSSIYRTQQTYINQNAARIELVAQSTVEIGEEVYNVQANLTVANDRISAEVERATTAEGGKIDKTSRYQTADSIVSEAVSQSATSAAGTFIAKTTTLQTATAIVNEAVAQAATSAGNSYIAKTTQMQTADAIVSEAVRQSSVNAANGYIAKTTRYQSADSIVSEAVSQSSTSASNTYIAKTGVYQTADSIVQTAESYTDNNAYKIQSGITINASGIEISGSKYVKIKSGGSFSVDSGKFSIDTSGNVSINGSVTSTSGSIGGFTLAANSLSSGASATYVMINSNASNTYAIWAGAEAVSNAPFRLKRDGTVYLTSLIAVGENGSETTVNLRTANLWKLSYNVVKSYTVSGGYCTAMVLSNGTTVNFKNAASVVATATVSDAAYLSANNSKVNVKVYKDGVEYSSEDHIIGTSDAYTHGHSAGISDCTVSATVSDATYISAANSSVSVSTYKNGSQTPYSTETHIINTNEAYSAGETAGTSAGQATAWQAAYDGSQSVRSGADIAVKIPSSTYGSFSTYNYQITVDSSWRDVAHLNVYAKINGITVATSTVRANQP